MYSGAAERQQYSYTDRFDLRFRRFCNKNRPQNSKFKPRPAAKKHGRVIEGVPHDGVCLGIYLLDGPPTPKRGPEMHHQK